MIVGVSDTGQTSDVTEWVRAAGHKVELIQSFEVWGKIPDETLKRWKEKKTIPMLSLSTAPCYGCPERIAPKEIARGDGDAVIAKMARQLHGIRGKKFLRLFPEMNAWWNPYAAYTKGGDSRPGHSTKDFRRAWRRISIILVGGERVKVNKRLRAEGLPPVKGKTKRLANANVKMSWVPQPAGSPDTPENSPRAYFPGWKYVDWIGGDVYGKFPSLAGLKSIKRTFPRRPFMVAEWSPWNTDDPSFTNDLLGWSSRNAKMVVYYQGFGEAKDNKFEITDYPLSEKALHDWMDRKPYR